MMPAIESIIEVTAPVRAGSRRHRARRWVAGLLALGMLGAVAPVLAEDPGYRLVPDRVPDIPHGKASIIRGDAGPEGDRMYIEHLSMLQPVSVVLMARELSRPLNLNLSKYRYDESDRAGDTGRDGAVAFHFRTQGELKIHVSPARPEAGPAPYYLVAWVGDEYDPELAPPVVLAGQAGGHGLPWRWLLPGGAVLAVLAFTFLAGRRSMR
ncbi:hypothetical protein HFP89_02400 [Wenzhouxiangella sp. XN79A]|uniref:hypothetical protein n=1 Tax=Wenzhouxiangella sp. XN79A TaxID=2724193 RepID=UPI00144AF682|nr:hypothetical protein [Wenzhouxiangella sp. XN79A]NKI34016.1 hypothetical protein [Wenzhouxiangella sp. XN79A]